MIETSSGDTKELATRALDRLIAAVEAGQSEQLKVYLAMLARFHRYSVSNLLLIMAQFPRAAHVAGYRTWQRLSRQVRRGSKAIRILAPIVRRTLRDADEDETILAFRTVSVFDISQTDGKPLPEPAQVRGDPGTHVQALKDFVANQSITLEYSDALGSAEGVARGASIVLRRGVAASRGALGSCARVGARDSTPREGAPGNVPGSSRDRSRGGRIRRMPSGWVGRQLFRFRLHPTLPGQEGDPGRVAGTDSRCGDDDYSGHSARGAPGGRMNRVLGCIRERRRTSSGRQEEARHD